MNQWFYSGGSRSTPDDAGTKNVVYNRRPIVTNLMHEMLLANDQSLKVSEPNGTYLLGSDLKKNSSPSVTFSFRSQRTFNKAFDSMRLLTFARAYLDTELDIDGDILDAAKLLYILNISSDSEQSLKEKIRFFIFRMAIAYLPQQFVPFKSLEHYSQSSKAYELFLDSHMQYTCGYFKSGNESIERAQIEKFNLIEEFIGPLNGKSHLDIGCGWGGLMDFFSKNYQTESVGITNCMDQRNYVQSRYNSEVIFGDFSTLLNSNRKFDVITIVGMMEHLTVELQERLFDVVKHVLNPDGKVYLQCMAKPDCWIGGDVYRLAQSDVFPGHYLEYPEVLEKRLESWGFTINNSEREYAKHYALTARSWVENLRLNRDEFKTAIARAGDESGEKGYRLYLGYLAMTAILFSEGRGSLRRYSLSM